MQKYVADRVSSVYNSFTEVGQIVDQVWFLFGFFPFSVVSVLFFFFFFSHFFFFFFLIGHKR